jgi:hypothetical protein
LPVTPGSAPLGIFKKSVESPFHMVRNVGFALRLAIPTDPSALTHLSV